MPHGDYVGSLEIAPLLLLHRHQNRPLENSLLEQAICGLLSDRGLRSPEEHGPLAEFNSRSRAAFGAMDSAHSNGPLPQLAGKPASDTPIEPTLERVQISPASPSPIRASAAEAFVLADSSAAVACLDSFISLFIS